MLSRSRLLRCSAATELLFDLNSQTRIATIALNRQSRKNALGKNLLSSLQQALKDCQANAARAVIVHSLVDGVFCAGADLKERKEMTPDEARNFVNQLRSTFCEIEDLPMPVIAAVEGKALGGGLELALAADLRVVSESAQLGVPETALAIIPGAGGSQRLVKTIGLPKAKLMMFTAAPVGAEEAARYGLVDRVTKPGAALEEAKRLAAAIALNGPIAIQAAKRAANDGYYAASREAGMAIEQGQYDRVLKTEDRLEGLKAFAEKRKPQYQGR